MKAKETMICWNPNSNQIKAGPWPDTTGWSRGYAFSGGACLAEVHKMTEGQISMMLFVEAIHTIVRDKVDPLAVHAAYLKLDEYRNLCACDMPEMDAQEQEG
jgi:hypothetical protein